MSTRIALGFVFSLSVILQVSQDYPSKAVRMIEPFGAALSANMHLISTGQGANDVAVAVGLVAVDLIEAGPDVVLCLRSGDLHRFRPFALTLVDREDMAGLVSYLNLLLLVLLH